MAPVDIIIDIIERRQEAIVEKTEGMYSEEDELKGQGGFEALEELKNELEGLKKLFS